jgi:pyridoxal phosphate enzyme (YggS family)
VTGPERPPAVEVVAERAAAVRHRIAAAGGDPARVTVVAVTKAFPPEVAAAAVGAGLADLGENYAQELAAKAGALAGAAVRWHAIGPVQRNKVKRIAGLVWLWQAVDRVEVGREIARRRPGASVLVQVNTTGEATKAGCRPGDVPALVDRLAGEGLAVRGLMALGPTDPRVDPRPGFAALRLLVDRLGLEVCSMGMSGDLEAAVAEGSTMVRVGTALFGPRDRSGAAGQ